MDHMNQLNLKNFCWEVASDSFTPGGGCVSAYSGALGASLGKMVLTLTIGKKKYAGFDEENKIFLDQISKIQEEMLVCVDRDAEGCKAIMKAMTLLKNTDMEKELRKAAMSNASKKANEAPLEVCDRCIKLLRIFLFSIGKVNRNAMSDWACGALQAYAGLEGAAMNALINLPSVDDPKYCVTVKENLQKMLGEGRKLFGEILTQVHNTFAPAP